MVGIEPGAAGSANHSAILPPQHASTLTQVHKFQDLLHGTALGPNSSNIIALRWHWWLIRLKIGL